MLIWRRRLCRQHGCVGSWTRVLWSGEGPALEVGRVDTQETGSTGDDMELISVEEKRVRSRGVPELK